MALKLRAAQAIVRALPPFVGSRVRTSALRAAGLRIQPNSTFWDLPTILGDVTALHIGAWCGFNTGCIFDLGGELFIDDHVSVGHDVLFLTRTWELGDSSRRAVREKHAPTRICSGAWIGARATILPGVTIGEGAVIGASVVVDKDVPAQTLVMGQQRISLAKWRTPGGKT
ncbi:MAG: acyltransferase [Archangium sp.]